jgi:hypothetical protein
MAKRKQAEAEWAVLAKAFTRELKLPKKALRKAVEEATIRLVAERIAEERLKGSLPAVNRPAPKKKSKKKSTGRKSG